MTSVRCGLASIIPLQLLNIFTPHDLDLRVCGLPDIDLDYLKVRTTPPLHVRVVDIVCLLSSCRDIPSIMWD